VPLRRCRSPLAATPRKRGRRSVTRGYRTYEICGFVRLERPYRQLLWLPGAAFALVVFFSAFALIHPPVSPSDLQRELPLARVAHYTAEDFFTAAR